MRTFCLTMVLTVLVSAARAERYEVFLLAGQSNMDGRGAKKELVGRLAEYAEPQKDVPLAFAAGGLHRLLTLSEGFVPLAPGYSGTPGKKAGGLPSNTFGPEVSFGRAMADGIIQFVVVPEGDKLRHYINIPKMRGAFPRNKMLSFTLNEEGLLIDTRERHG